MVSTIIPQLLNQQSRYLNDGIIDVHVVLLANGSRRQLAQQHLHRNEELQDAHLLAAGILVAVVAGVGQGLCCCRLHTRSRVGLSLGGFMRKRLCNFCRKGHKSKRTGITAGSGTVSQRSY